MRRPSRAASRCSKRLRRMCFVSDRMAPAVSPSSSRNISATQTSSQRSKACSSRRRPVSISAFWRRSCRSAPGRAAPSTTSRGRYCPALLYRVERSTLSRRTSTSPARWRARSARRFSSASWHRNCTSRRRRAAGARRAFRSSRACLSRWLEWSSDRSCAMSDNDARVLRLLLTQEIAEFLYREAEILDERRYDDWLALLADDIRYWMPMRRNVKYGEEEREFTRERQDIAWFDEGKDTLIRRVKQIQTGIHWAEEPVSRISHLVTNVQLVEATPSD